jgi:hypothetical protein
MTIWDYLYGFPIRSGMTIGYKKKGVLPKKDSLGIQVTVYPLSQNY